jgi:hypothetical protein
MSLFTIFGKIGHVLINGNRTASVATGVAAFNSDPLSAVLQMVGNAVFAVESTAAAAPGADKKEQVKRLIDVSSPVILETLLAINGQPLAEPEALAPALDGLIDVVVKLFNATGLFQHKAPAAIPPHA